MVLYAAGKVYTVKPRYLQLDGTGLKRRHIHCIRDIGVRDTKVQLYTVVHISVVIVFVTFFNNMFTLHRPTTINSHTTIQQTTEPTL